jgi:nucleoside 2-deoxyribosyltransferase
MGRCFVIQPFDGGQFDKRFDDVLIPSIAAADLEAYRVDRDDSASIPIEAIEKGIRSADVCLADISLERPNVWFEVGFAIASGKDVILICSTAVERFPFDIQHRSVIRYKTEAPSDFEKLKTLITARLKAAIKKKNDLASIADLSPLLAVDGLSDHQMVALVSICETNENAISPWQLKQEMQAAGYTNIAANLAARSLMAKGFVEQKPTLDDRGNEYDAYRATPSGFLWLEANQHKLLLKHPPKLPSLQDETDVPF